MLQQDFGIYKVIEKYAEKYPVQNAVIDGEDGSVGFADFINVYDYFIRFFNQNDFKNFERFAVITDEVLSYCLMVLPVMYRATWVPLSPDLSIEKAREQLELFGISYIITNNVENSVCRIAASMGIGIITFSMKGGFSDKKCTLDLISKKTIEIPDYKKKSEHIIVRSTSGTTGMPKIVPITYSAYRAALNQKFVNRGYTNKDIMLIYTNVYKAQSINSMILMLVKGGTSVITDGFNHNSFFEIIDRYKITTFTATPAVLNSLAEYIEKNNIVCSNNSLRFIRSSGALLTERLKDLIESSLATELVISYGMTETRNISSTYGLPKGIKTGSVGISSGVKVKIEEDEILVK